MSMRLRIVASCTNRKRLPVPSDLRLRTIPVTDIAKRARKWCARLADHPSQIRSAAELYGGDHWSVVQSLSDAARAAGFTPELWVISAGYGLVSQTAPLHAYSATFAHRDADSVARGVGIFPHNPNEAWWEQLTMWAGPESGAPRSLEMLARDDPGAGLLVMGSPDYLRAVETDLLAAARCLDDDRRLVVISSREAEKTSVGGYLIVSESKLQSQLGGARISLHARVGRQVLNFAFRCGWEVGRLRHEYKRTLSAMTERNVNRRLRLTDDVLRRFICEALEIEPRIRVTTLLKRLRSRGQACEQNRFKALFGEVQKRCGAA